MEDKSQISYWYEDESLLTIPTNSVPSVGEEIHIDTRMDKLWYDSRFSDKKLFHKGIIGTFVVTHVKRYYKNLDYVLEDGKYKFPAQSTVETFEVFLEKKIN